MSKTRYIKTDFWSDTWIESLNTEEKLLFIYLFSNERVDLCWTYEITMKKISFESWIEIKKTEKYIEWFSKKWKVFYIDWYIHIKNFTKHLQKNPSVEQWIERSNNALPKPIQEAVHRLYTGCTQDGTLVPIPILNSTLPEPIGGEFQSKEIIPVELNEYQESIRYLKNIDKEKIPEYAEEYQDEWIKFCYYWSEKWKTWKIRAEWEKTFEIKRRFATWMSRKKEDYQKTQQPKRWVF